MLRIPLPEYADGTLTLHLLISGAQIRHPRGRAAKQHLPRAEVNSERPQ